MRKLKAFYYAACKRTDAMLRVLIFLKKILIFRSKVRVGVGGKEKKAWESVIFKRLSYSSTFYGGKEKIKREREKDSNRN